MPQKTEDQLGRRLKAITGDLKLYIEKRIELLLLNVGEHFARIMAESVHKMAGFVLLTGASLCLLVALALYLGNLLGSPSLGYVIVSIPLLVFGILFVYLKPKSVLKRIQNQFEKEIVEAISAAEHQDKQDLLLEDGQAEKQN